MSCMRCVAPSRVISVLGAKSTWAVVAATCVRGLSVMDAHPSESLAAREAGWGKRGKRVPPLHCPGAPQALFLSGGHSSQLSPFNCGGGARFLACRKVDQTV